MSEKLSSANGTFLLCVLLLTASSRVGLAQPLLSIYDNFDAPKISTDKWRGGEGASQLGQEATRGIENGQLRLTTRSVGFTASDNGFGTNFIFLGLPSPEAAGDMKARVTATNVNDVGCSENSAPTQSFAGLAGSFFNAGTPQNGDETNDVIAAVGISSDSERIAANKRPQVIAYVIQCADKSCDTFSELDLHSFGPVALGTPVTVEMRWNPDLHEFFFNAFGGIGYRYRYAGVVTDTSSPGVAFKNLQAQNNVANCTTKLLEPRPVAKVSALYDNVGLAPTCATIGAACSSPDSCCVSDCYHGACCSNTVCSSNEDCCSFTPGVMCGGQGSPHCCAPTGAPCGPATFPDCCSNSCIITGDDEGGNCA